MSKRVSPAGALIGGVLGFWIAVAAPSLARVANWLMAGSFAGWEAALVQIVWLGAAGVLWGAVLGGIIAKTPHIAVKRSALLGAFYGAITSTMIRDGSASVFGSQVLWMLLLALLGAAVATVVGFMLRPRRQTR